MNFLRNRYVQLGAIVALLSAVGIRAFQVKYSVRDFDIWWHLKVGDWIIDNLAVPHSGILSRTAAELPWVAYSWGYEVLLSRFYAWFGLIGIALFGTLLTIGVAFFVYWMIQRLSNRPWLAVLLAAVVCAAFLFNGMPRPVFFSMMLTCVILALVIEAQRTGRITPLYWLIPVFALWANLHIQFIYGLFVVGLFVGVQVGLQILNSLRILPGWLMQPSLPALPLLGILGLCLAATIVGPNTYHPYLVVLAYSKAKFSYKIIIELQPLSFRGLSNYTELFLAAAAFYAIGWRKTIDVFKLLLLLAAAVSAFRTMRDGWFLCVCAAACLADFPAPEEFRSRPLSWKEFGIVTAASAVVLTISAPFANFNSRELDAAISQNYPVNAINVLRRTPHTGPLYNNLNWGGFLMWYLPDMPVAIDGRNDLYGDKLDEVFYYTESGFPSYATDPYLNEAGTVILQSDLPLAKLLTIDPRFQLIYHDDIATVFLRRNSAVPGSVQP